MTNKTNKIRDERPGKGNKRQKNACWADHSSERHECMCACVCQLEIVNEKNETSVGIRILNPYRAYRISEFKGPLYSMIITNFFVNVPTEISTFSNTFDYLLFVYIVYLNEWKREKKCAFFNHKINLKKECFRCRTAMQTYPKLYVCINFRLYNFFFFF